MKRLIVMVCAFLSITAGLFMQLPVLIVGGTTAALVGLAPWTHDHRQSDRKV